VLEEAQEGAIRFVRLREQPAPQPLEAFLKRTAREAELPETLVPRLTELLEGETIFSPVRPRVFPSPSACASKPL
jgi:hypothetical protein